MASIAQESASGVFFSKVVGRQGNSSRYGFSPCILVKQEGRPLFLFFWFLPGRDTYVLFSLSTGLFLPDLPLSLSIFSLSPFIIVGRKIRKEDNDNDDDARFCRVYM